ncbi:MAG: M23 family metallopeptidase [Candidatus Paceibacterota bacterium]|jgi:LysM repeat protein
MKLQTKKETKYSGKWAILMVAFLSLSLLVFGKTANAGLVSFMSSIFNSEQASAKINQTASVVNSQNINVLQAHANVISMSDILSDTTPIDDGEMLVADLAAIGVNGEDTSNTQISTYLVQQGDTISGVAKMFRVSVNTVLWANNLTSRSVLRVGQTLVILPVTGISHVVKKGDTVQGIAKKYSADVTDIYSYNDLPQSSALSVGQTLIIPNAEFVPIVDQSTVKGRIKVAPYEPLIGDIASLPSYPGYYSCPVIGARLSQTLHGRNALDFAAPVGTPLRAAAAGIVIISKSNGAYNGGYGNFVVISHANGTQTLYAHMSKSAVSAGSQVSKGQIIGYIGMTGLTTGPHTHFEIRGAKNFAVGTCN